MLKNFILLALMCMAMPIMANENGADIYVNSITVDIRDLQKEPNGLSIDIPLMLKGTETSIVSVTAWECKVIVPEGFEITKVARGSLIRVKNDDDEYIFSWDNSKEYDGSRYLQCYTVKDYAITQEGELAKITINISKEVQRGNYELKLIGIETANGGVIQNTYTEYTTSITVDKGTDITGLNYQNENETVKVIKNNRLYIKKGTEMFSVTGNRVK